MGLNQMSSVTYKKPSMCPHGHILSGIILYDLYRHHAMDMEKTPAREQMDFYCLATSFVHTAKSREKQDRDTGDKTQSKQRMGDG